MQVSKREGLRIDREERKAQRAAERDAQKAALRAEKARCVNFLAPPVRLSWRETNFAGYLDVVRMFWQRIWFILCFPNQGHVRILNASSGASDTESMVLRSNLICVSGR